MVGVLGPGLLLKAFPFARPIRLEKRTDLKSGGGVVCNKVVWSACIIGNLYLRESSVWQQAAGNN